MSFCTIFWNDITIIWDENTVHFFTEKKPLFLTNKKFVYSIFINQNMVRISYKRTWTSLYLPSTQDFPPGQGTKGVHLCWQWFWRQTGLFGFISRHSSLLENSILIKKNHDWLLLNSSPNCFMNSKFRILNSNGIFKSCGA